MLNQYEPTVKATIAFLRLLNVKVNSKTVDETLQNHPDWPSLLCISDSLNKWNVINGAGKIDTANIDELPVPFVAHTTSSESPLYIITEVADTTVQIFQKEYNKIITESKESFIKKWTGVYLIAESNGNSGEENYDVIKRTFFLNSLVSKAAFIALMALSIMFLERVINTTALNFNPIGIYLHYCILMAGVIITSLLLWYEVDSNNPILQKVCGGITKGDCNAILTSKQSKLFSWLSWSEIGFFYFIGGLFTLLFAGNAINDAIPFLFWINVLALPYTVFSVYYQWRIAKQWCVLCLIVQALLVLGVVNIVASNYAFIFPVLSVPFIVIIMLCYLLPVFIWYSLKPYILSLQVAKNTKREYLRIKFSSEIYDTLLKKQKKITISTEGLGIDLGNPSAKNTLIKVCNPYCSYCGKAHADIESLLNNAPNLKVKIIFYCRGEADTSVIPAKHLLSIAENKNEALTKQALDDWYLAEKNDYEVFVKKYPLNTNLDRHNDSISNMKNWCQQMSVSATPTCFINGYQLPDAYNIEDLQYFLLE
jgi:hypothetical protein